MKKTIKLLGLVIIGITALVLLSGCGNDETKSREITVVSREDGSGTRGAFIELFGIEQKNPDGTKKDLTTKEAITTSKTDVMLTTIANDKNSIGYVSLGSVNSSIKAVSIDGAKATQENVKNGKYKISRPFNIVTKGEKTGVTKDFIDFILSKEGQEVVGKDYIAIETTKSYSGSNQSGKIVIVGSSSVNPMMEKLKEAYVKINPDVKIEIQANDSSSGIAATANGTCDIGMASRELKESEQGDLKETKIATDGIAVIVNKENTISNLTKEQVKSIFTGNTTKWEEVE